MWRKGLETTPIMPKYIIHKTIEGYTIHQPVQDIKMGTRTTEDTLALANLIPIHSPSNTKIETTKIECPIEVPTLITCILITIITEKKTTNSNLFGSMKTIAQGTHTILDDSHIPYTSLITLCIKS